MMCAHVLLMANSVFDKILHCHLFISYKMVNSVMQAMDVLLFCIT